MSRRLVCRDFDPELLRRDPAKERGPRASAAAAAADDVGRPLAESEEDRDFQPAESHRSSSTAEGGGSSTHASEDEESRLGGDFRFAGEYSAEELLSDVGSRHRFFGDFLRWEGRFLHTGVGIAESGLTCDGAHILGDGSLSARTQSNPSKEALHLALLALAVLRDGLVRQLLRPEEALAQLRAKAAALERCREERPELCGFMPWFDAAAGGRPLEGHAATRHNGMLAWTLYFTVKVLQEVGEAVLAHRFERHLHAMRDAAVRLAYKGDGKVAAWFSLPPRGGAAVKSPQNSEDPFAGELFCMFLDLLAEWPAGGDAAAEKDAIWEDAARHRWLAWGTVDVELDGAKHTLAAMAGSTFSAHEELKHLLMPYDEVPEARRPLHAAERLRTWWSRARGLPGMLGDCHVPPAASPGGVAPGAPATAAAASASTVHVTSFGIPGAVSGLGEAQARCDHVAGNGAFATLLASPGVGAAWLHETLSAHEGMQTPWGVAESCAADGSAACPLLTWDGKATTSLAVLGGLGPQMRRYLEQDGLFDRFASILERLYGEVAGCEASRTVPGEMLGFAPPPSVAAATAEACKALQADRRLDLQMIKEIGRGSVLPGCDALTLSAARHWFQDHEEQPGAAPYCVGTDFETWQQYQDWYTTGSGHYGASTEEDRDRLYEIVVSCFKIGTPLVLLARQAPRYPLFFDIDIWGGTEESPRHDQIRRLTWEDSERLLFRAVVAAVLELYPQFNDSLEVAMFTSSGFCSRKGRFKASYHLYFPDIIVDRPVKCLPEARCCCAQPPEAGHFLVRNHVVCRLQENAALQELQDELCACCDWKVAEPWDELEGAEQDEDPAYLNDFSEIFDERPLWHEPSPEAATGMRLPFTDKPREGRPKMPFGRWQFSVDPFSNVGDGEWPPEFEVERLRDLEPMDWVRLGDISAVPDAPVTRREGALHPKATDELRCPECSECPDDEESAE